jgi:transketolase
MPTRNLVSALPTLDALGVNVRIVAAISPQLFARQPSAYRSSITAPGSYHDAMVITNGAFKLMQDWASGPLVREYSLSSDWDDRWRTGGSVDEVIAEAHLSESDILTAIQRFAADRTSRLSQLRAGLD